MILVVKKGSEHGTGIFSFGDVLMQAKIMSEDEALTFLAGHVGSQTPMAQRKILFENEFFAKSISVLAASVTPDKIQPLVNAFDEGLRGDFEDLIKKGVSY